MGGRNKLKKNGNILSFNKNDFEVRQGAEFVITNE